MKKTLLAALAVAFAGHAAAQDLPQRFKQLPDLPPSSQINKNYIGNHYLLGQGMNKEPVVFSGYNIQGQAVAFSLVDIPDRKATQQATLQKCAEKGPGWKVPRIDEIMLLTPHVNDAARTFLPGQYWTTTLAPCDETCIKHEQFYITYNILNGNQRNSYNFEALFKSYPVCAYTF